MLGAVSATTVGVSAAVSAQGSAARGAGGVAGAASHHALRTRVEGVLASAPGRDAQARVLERRMRVFMILQIGEFLVLLYAPWWWLKVASAALFALYRARTVWTIVHDRVHLRELPNTVAKLFYDCSTIFVVRFWKAHHLRHHAHTNTARDPDTRMFVGRDLNDVLAPAAPRWSRALRFLGTVAQYPFFFVLFIYRSLATYKGGGIAVYLLVIVAYAVGVSALLPSAEARLNTGMNFAIGAVYILFTFAPTHSATKANFELAGDPVADAFIATNDVWPRSRAWSSFAGGINLHVEHHLFPHVPSQELHRLAPIVEGFAREHGLPYNAYSPYGIWRAHLAFLWRS